MFRSLHSPSTLLTPKHFIVVEVSHLPDSSVPKSQGEEKCHLTGLKDMTIMLVFIDWFVCFRNGWSEIFIIIIIFIHTTVFADYTERSAEQKHSDGPRAAKPR